MRGGRWVFAIGAWTMCTAALGALGVGKVEGIRDALLAEARQKPVVTPSGSPSPSPGAPRTLTTPGGRLVASCNAGKVWVEWMSPATGFQVQDADQGPNVESHLTFKANDKEVRVVVRCAEGGPRADVTRG